MVALGHRRFCVGAWVVDVASGRIAREGEVRTLRPKEMALLVHLAGRQGEIVGRDEIHREVWQGAAVCDDAIYNAVGQLRKALGDDNSRPAYIRTFSRRGYCLIAPVRPLGTIRLAAWASSRAASVSAYVVTGGIAIGLVLGGVDLMSPSPFPAPADESAPPAEVGGLPVMENGIAVLPFTLADGTADEGHLGPGLAAELIDSLAQAREVRVIAPSSSFRLAEDTRRPREVGRALGVAYVVDGALSRRAGGIEIRLRLSRAEDETVVLSGTFESAARQLTALGPAMARAVLEQLHLPVPAAASRRDTVDAEAFDLYLRGHDLLRRGRNDADAAAQAVKAFSRAVEIAPDFAPAWAALAEAAMVGSMYRIRGPSPAGTRAGIALDRALELDAGRALTHALLGFHSLWFELDPDKADAAFRRALDINPGLAQTYVWRALLFREAGRFVDSLASLEQAHRLNPLSLEVLNHLSQEYAIQGRHAEAEALLDKGARLGMGGWADFVRGIWYAEFGRLADAAAILPRVAYDGPAERLGVAERKLVLTLLALGDARAADGIAGLYRDIVLLHRGEPEEALRFARERSQGMQGNFHELWLASFEARCLAVLGRPAEVAARLDPLIAGERREIHLIAAFGEFGLPSALLVWAWRRTGETARADELLRATKTFVEGFGQAGFRLPLTLYARAQIAALEGKREAALALLEQALAAGWRWQVLARVDPILGPLLDDPALAPALAAAKADIAREREKWRGSTGAEES